MMRDSDDLVEIMLKNACKINIVVAALILIYETGRTFIKKEWRDKFELLVRTFADSAQITSGYTRSSESYGTPEMPAASSHEASGEKSFEKWPLMSWFFRPHQKSKEEEKRRIVERLLEESSRMTCTEEEAINLCQWLQQKVDESIERLRILKGVSEPPCAVEAEACLADPSPVGARARDTDYLIDQGEKAFGVHEKIMWDLSEAARILNETWQRNLYEIAECERRSGHRLPGQALNSK